MSLTPIITKEEVKKWLRISSEFPDCELSDLYECEDEELIECFGEDLKEELLDHLIDYSNAEQYDPSKTYEKGDVVIYCGMLKIALSDAPSKEPDCNDQWGTPTKFDKECYNELWCNYGLGKYIAIKIGIDLFPDMILKITGKGLVKSKGMDFEHATDEDRKFKVASYYRQAAKAMKRVKRYLLKCDDDTCFTWLQNNSCSCSNDPCKCGTPTGATWNIC